VWPVCEGGTARCAATAAWPSVLVGRRPLCVYSFTYLAAFVMCREASLCAVAAIRAVAGWRQHVWLPHAAVSLLPLSPCSNYTRLTPQAACDGRSSQRPQEEKKIRDGSSSGKHQAGVDWHEAHPTGAHAWRQPEVARAATGVWQLQLGLGGCVCCDASSRS
jgi:hypothetical protein